MHRHLKRALVALAILAAAVLAGAWALARTDYAAGRVARLIEQATGQPASVGGLSITPGRRLGVELSDVAVLAKPAAAPHLLDVGSVEVAVPWRVLLGGRLRIEQLTVKRAVLRLGIAADGSDDWTPLVEQLTKWLGPGPSSYDLGRFELAESALELRDERDGSTLRLTAIGVETGALRPRQPFDGQLRLAGQLGPHVFHARASGRLTLDTDASRYSAGPLVLNAWLGGDALPIAGIEADGSIAGLQADLAAGTARVDGLKLSAAGIALAGQAQATSLDTAPQVGFDLATQDFDPRVVAATAGIELPPMQDPTALGRARITAQGSWQGATLTLATLDARLDDTHATGSLVYATDGSAAPVLRLDADQVDLGRYLAPDQPKARAPTSLAGTLEQGIAALRELDLDARITLGEARLDEVRAKQLRIVVEPNERPAPQAP